MDTLSSEMKLLLSNRKRSLNERIVTARNKGDFQQLAQLEAELQEADKLLERLE